jgi:hypothetical protein
MARSKRQQAAGVARTSRRGETREHELARLVREQREDQRQEKTGLRRTVLGDVLRGIGVCLDDDGPPRRPSRHGVDGADDE